MSRKVFVHVGAPKTGTTYLQGMLDTNQATLARHDVHFPARITDAAPSVFHFRAALDLLGQDWGGEPGHAEGAWEALVRRVRRSSGITIVSHEILAPAPPEAAERAKRELTDAGAELHVVYTARDPSRLLPAAWQESIKQGRQWTYARFLQRTLNNRTWFAKAFNLPKVLTTWGGGLAPEQIHVVTVPKRTDVYQPRSDELWKRFCEACSIDPAWAPEEATSDNRSLGIPETALLRKLNRRMDSPVRREAEYDRLIRQLLAQEELVGRRSTSVQLPPELHPRATEMAERWIEWIEASGIHVVGATEDLLPPAPIDPKDWVDPDKARPSAILDAALDALVAMTREAARRAPGQEVRLREKLWQRVRRS